MLWIDGKHWSDHVIVDEITESVTIETDGNDLVSLTGRKRYNVIGKRLKHTIKLVRNPSEPIEEWEELHSVISEPREYHEFQVPSGQGYVIYQGHIFATERALLRYEAGKAVWGDSLTIEVENSELMEV